YLRAALASKAAAVMTELAFVQKLDEISKPLLLVSSTRAALATLLTSFARAQPQGPFRHPSAVVHESARIGPDVWLGPCVVVGPRAHVGAGCVLHAGAILGSDARVGSRGLLYPHAMLLDGCIAGDDVVLQPGAVVGSEGFGWVFIDGRLEKIPQVGNVELGDHVEIGANTTIDRAQTGTTRIGSGTKVDNLCQIGHNVRIGKHSALAAMVGVAGSTSLGDHVQIGGQAGLNGHISVGSRVKIAGGAHVWSDIPDDAVYSGMPAQEHRKELRWQARLRSIDKLFARVDALERKS
ncbi:MAG TPA: UDP-3-O-(3-hydroxymyristoyl)glucosamine N-acyltransferase, partial [Candidatus Baltobacteraceae bacterium]